VNRLRRAALSAALLPALLIPAGPAEAGFAPGSEVLANAPSMFLNGAAMDAGGKTIVVWEARPEVAAPSAVFGRFVSAGGELGPILPISTAADPEASQAAVAISGAGNAFVAWRSGMSGERQDVVGRWVRVDGSMGAPITIEEGSIPDDVDPVEIRVAIDPAGVATVAWRNQDMATPAYNLALRRIGPDGPTGPVSGDLGNANPVFDVDIAALPGGGTVVVWRESAVWKNVVSPELEVGMPDQISSAQGSRPGIAIDSAGNGLVAWRAGASPFGVNGVRLAPTGAQLGALLEIDPPDAPFVGIDVPVAGFDGNFLVGWGRDSAGQRAFFIRAVRADGSMGPPDQRVSPPTGGDAEYFFATPVAGAPAAAAWTQAMTGGQQTFGQGLDPLGAPLGPALPFGYGGTNLIAAYPSFGAAAFVTRYVGPGVNLAVRRFLAAPVCRELTLASVQGRLASASADCTGPAIEGGTVTTPPAHGTATTEIVGGRLEVRYRPKPGYAGLDTFTFAATNDGGSSTPVRAAVRVGRDTVRPRIVSLRLRKGQVGKRRPRVTTHRLEVRITEPARATVTIEGPRRGVRRGKRCLKPSKGATGKSCTRYVRVGRLRSSKPARLVKLPIRGKLDRKIAGGGRFRATAVARDPAGNRSKPRHKTFRLMVKRPNGGGGPAKR
jgi:hypothetical protein